MPSDTATPSASDLFDLNGRVAIVTGASSGFGVRFAKVLSEAGASVVASARRRDRLEALAAEVPNVIPVVCDVSSDDDLNDLVIGAEDRFGKIDILVNNAGMSDSPVKAEEQDPALFRRWLM